MPAPFSGLARHLERRQEVLEYHGHAGVHRFDQMRSSYVYPVPPQDRLPKIEIPLPPRDGRLTIDRHAVFDRSDDAERRRPEIDDRHDVPDPPLVEARTAWAKQRIAAWKKRSKPFRASQTPDP